MNPLLFIIIWYVIGLVCAYMIFNWDFFADLIEELNSRYTKDQVSAVFPMLALLGPILIVLMLWDTGVKILDNILNRKK